jgi:hypothetical protein
MLLLSLRLQVLQHAISVVLLFTALPGLALGKSLSPILLGR